MGLKYQVIEDNGGGLALAVFFRNKVIFLHHGYEEWRGLLLANIEDLKNGDNPKKDGWDGNEDYPQAVYDDIVSREFGWAIIADQDGIYPDMMGAAGAREFNIRDEDEDED